MAGFAGAAGVAGVAGVAGRRRGRARCRACRAGAGRTARRRRGGVHVAAAAAAPVEEREQRQEHDKGADAPGPAIAAAPAAISGVGHVRAVDAGPIRVKARTHAGAERGIRIRDGAVIGVPINSHGKILSSVARGTTPKVGTRCGRGQKRAGRPRRGAGIADRSSFSDAYCGVAGADGAGAAGAVGAGFAGVIGVAGLAGRSIRGVVEPVVVTSRLLPPS